APAAGRMGGRRRRWPRGPRTTPVRYCRDPGSSPGGRSSCTWLGSSYFDLPQGSLAERENFLPAVHGLFLTVRRAVVVEEPVTGAIVAVELILLAVLLELGLVCVDLFRCGRLVLVAEEPEDRAREVLRVVDGGHRLARRQLFLRLDHASAPAVDHGVE